MLKLQNISKTYSTKDGVTHRALNNISLSFESTGLVFILGKSGSGKSTLLNIIGGLDSFDRGEIYLYDKPFSSFKSFDYDFYRNTFTGFIFQEFNLINELTIEENVMLSLDLQSKKDHEKIDQIFEELDISELKDRKSFELSGGQKQRVAIARALVKNPSIILADEPTGSLDTNTTSEILQILSKLAKNHLVIVITHNREIAESYGDRIIELKDGEILKDLSTQSNNEYEETPSLIASSILKIPSSVKVKQEDVDKVNEVLKNEKIDHYLSFETNPNKVKSIFPHLKEAININKNESNEKFKQYVYKDGESKEVKLIKSKLPFKRGLLFGLSNLKVKISKLIFTIILSILAVTISGCVDNFANYDVYKAMSNSIVNNDYKYIKIKSAYSIYHDYTLKDIEIENINKLNNAEAPLIYSKQLKITNYELDWHYVLNNSVSSIVETDNIEKYGYEYLIKSNNEYENNGIVISQLLAREIAYTMNQNDIDVIDLPLHLNDKVFYIKGIYKCMNLDKFDILRTDNSFIDLDLLSEYNILYSDYLSQIFVDYGFIDYYKNELQSFEEYSLDVSFDSYEYSFVSNLLLKKQEDMQLVSYSDEKGIYLPESMLKSYMAMSEISDEAEYVNLLNNSGIKIEVSNRSSDSICYISNKLKIKGYVKDYEGIVVEDELFNELNNYVLRPTGAFLDFQDLKKSEILDLVNEIYSNGFIINEPFVSYYDNLIEVFSLLSSLLSGINILIFVLAIILLFSFMLTSIRNNVKQIGILRALGANVLDIIKIYVIEAFIIGGISLAISLLLYGVGGIIVNNSLQMDYVSIFTFSTYTVLKMVSSTIIVVALSLIIPIIKITKMQPVDAIRNEK